MLIAEEYRALIAVVQEKGLESEQALGDILVDISIHHMDRYMRRYLDKATTGVIDFDDLCQSFLIGCSEAVAIATSDIGCPLAFILQKGRWKALNELGKTYRRDLRQICYECGADTKLFGKSGAPVCRKCGIEGYQYIERYEVTKKDEGTILLATDVRKDLQEVVASEIFVEGFQNRLTGRKREVFDLIIHGGYDRGSCKNYIASIADRLGISSSNVNLRLRAIKEDWATYLIDMKEGVS